jgi:hypothetical protein
VSLFYPRAGQDPNGQCWLGLTIDRAGNLYVVENFGCKRIYKYTAP